MKTNPRKQFAIRILTVALAAAVVFLASCAGDDDTTRPSPSNTQPVADAGPDQTVTLGPVVLDGGNSHDADGDSLTFLWILATRPAASTGVLSDSAAVAPTFVADVAGDFVAHLVVNDGNQDSAPDSVTIHAIVTPSISAFSRTIGAGLQYGSDAVLAVSNHGGVTVHIESDDPTVALIAPDGNTPGSTFIDVPVPDGDDHVPYVVQGVAGKTGAVGVAVSASGFDDGTGLIDVVPAGLAVSGPDTTQSVGTNDFFGILTGPLNSAGTALFGIQGMSAANVPPLVLTVTSTDGAVGQVSAGGNTGATIMIDLTAGTSQVSLNFEPLSVGPTTVSASIPGFVSLPPAVQITVDAPNISPFSRTIGAGLQYGSDATLAVSNHGGVTVHIESDDPTVALVAPDADTPGSAFIDVLVSDGDDRVPYVVQGVAGLTGAVTITASAPGFDNGTGSIDVVTAGLSVSGLDTAQSVGASDVFGILTGPLNSAGTGLFGIQGMSAANVPPLVLTVMSTDGAVGRVSSGGNTGASIMIDLTAGTSQVSVTFEPLSVGPTTVSAGVPGFVSLPPSVDVTVSP